MSDTKYGICKEMYCKGCCITQPNTLQCIKCTEVYCIEGKMQYKDNSGYIRIRGDKNCFYRGLIKDDKICYNCTQKDLLINDEIKETFLKVLKLIESRELF